VFASLDRGVPIWKRRGVFYGAWPAEGSRGNLSGTGLTGSRILDFAKLISPETIALVRDRTDLIALVSESVPSLKRRGRSWVGLCPFHKEKTGSFHVNPDKGFFHCFGCKESGSAIDFVMKQEGSTFPEAVRSLAERVGVPIEEDERAPSEALRQKKQRDDLYAVTQLAAVFFERQLREHPQRQFALDELERRGLVPSWAGVARTTPATTPTLQGGLVDDAIQAFRIGYAPAGWDSLANFLKQQGVSPLAAETVGLLVPRSSGAGHYDRFRHRLMFAVIDPQGRVVGFSGRALPPVLDDGSAGRPPGAGLGPREGQEEQKPAKYINSPESPVYTKGHALFGLYQGRHAIRLAESATVVEGNFDVVSLHARGIDNVVAPLGTAFTVDQAKLLRRFTSNVVLLFDGDSAGKKAASASREPCMTAGLSAKVAALPAGTDPDELVRTRGPDALKYVLDCARPMTKGSVDARLEEAESSSDPHSKLAAVNDIVRLISEETDPLVRAELWVYADSVVASRLDIGDGRDAEGRRTRDVSSLRALREKFQKAAAAFDLRGPVGPSPRQARVTAREPGAAERAEMVGALIEHPELLEDAEVRASLSLLEGPSARTVAALADSLRSKPETDETSDESAALQSAGQPPLQEGAKERAQDRAKERAQDRDPERAQKRSGPTQKTLDTSSFLAQIPPPIQAFASERLAAPRHENREDAKGHLLDNARKLRTVILGRETSDLAREAYRALGDWQAETDLAREAAERAKQKLGLGRGQQ
jgi:DNA primase